MASLRTNKQLKVVYLFGAGATHAEKSLECKIRKTGLHKTGKLKAGLLARNISRRVIKKLLENKPDIPNRYGIDEFFLEDKSDTDIDIELFISLLEITKTNQTIEDAKVIRDFFQKDILNNLTVNRREIMPRLCSALLQLHSKNTREELSGILTLNYDNLIEKAFKETGINFDFGFDILPIKHVGNTDNADSGNPYLLKLHGSFNWYFDSSRIHVSGKPHQDIQWIPPRLNKEYSEYPYNIIHGKAYELLSSCDILRVVGCSLSLNDITLISLLFKTQKSQQPRPYLIEIIDSQDTWNRLTKRLGMSLSFDESFYDKDEWKKLGRTGDNPFLDWLYYKFQSLGKIDSARKNTKSIEKWINL